MRDGELQQIHQIGLVVGDVVVLEPGDAVPADGVVIHGTEILCDESSLTGESEAVRKNNGNSDAYFMQSGTTILEVSLPEFYLSRDLAKC